LLGPALVGAAWLTASKLAHGQPPLGVEPIYPALLTGALVFALDRAWPRKKS
jgi:hypothetical protein